MCEKVEKGKAQNELKKKNKTFLNKNRTEDTKASASEARKETLECAEDTDMEVETSEAEEISQL